MRRLQSAISGILLFFSYWAIFCSCLVAVGVSFNFIFLYEHGNLAPEDGFSALTDFFSQLVYVPLFFTAARLVKMLPDPQGNWDWRSIAEKTRALSFLLLLNFILGVASTLQNRTDTGFRSFQEYGGETRNVSDLFHYALKFLWFADGIYPLFVPQFYGAASLLLALLLFATAKAMETIEPPTASPRRFD
jgi:hypothetical protein